MVSLLRTFFETVVYMSIVIKLVLHYYDSLRHYTIFKEINKMYLKTFETSLSDTLVFSLINFACFNYRPMNHNIRIYFKHLSKVLYQNSNSFKLLSDQDSHRLPKKYYFTWSDKKSLTDYIYGPTKYEGKK